MTHFDFRQVQRVMDPLLSDVRSVPVENLPTVDEVLPVALELIYTALCMKWAYAQGGLKIAERYCSRMGQDYDQILAFAIERVTEEIAQEGQG